MLAEHECKELRRLALERLQYAYAELNMAHEYEAAAVLAGASMSVARIFKENPIS